MQMSLGYMRETVAALAEKGFAAHESKTDYGDGVVGYLFTLTRPEVELVLETVVHPEQPETYYLEIKSYHGLRSHSFQLDSWKHRADRVELKYQPSSDGEGGLALTLRLDA
jgi:hypothetical protein